MARCEDFPCCGHELGCCLDFGADGTQLNMVCTCGAKVPIDSGSSLCQFCLTHEFDEDGRPVALYESDDYEDEEAEDD